MAIVQISKIQQRSGNLVDLPQLDEAELGWASDEKRLFIGKTTPNENVEVLTAYSNISFSQIDGSDSANLNLGNTANGQILGIEVVGSNTYVVNKGGNVGGLIDLGNVGDITISGGAIGYVLETDGLGNLSWTPKSTITANISAVTKANPGVITTTQDNFFTEGALVTITNVGGMTELNGNDYYANIISANSFALYSDSGLTTPVDTSGFTTYTSGGRVISSIGGSGTATAGGSNTAVQFNDNNVIQGNAGFTFNKVSGAMAVPGNITTVNATLGNLTTSNYFAGTLTTAAQPNITSVGSLTSLTVTGNANVGNLGTAGLIVATGNVTGGNLVTAGIVSATGNVVAGNVYANSGTVKGTLLTGTLTTAAQPNITSTGTLTSLAVTGNITAGNVNVSSGVVSTTQLTTGANTTAGTITGNWTLTSGSKLEATYADLAEYYESDIKYEPGTVLEFGGEKEVTIAEDGTSRVAGVVSTNPAYAMNANCKGIATAIALQGRVPTKVRGNIRKGDMMVSGGNGFARPSISPQMGTVIGKALENFDGIEGVIEIAVGRL